MDYLSAKGDVFATAQKSGLPIDGSHNSFRLDIRRKEDCLEVIKLVKPDVVVLLAAISKLGHCFNDQELAWETNVNGAENIALLSRETNARVVYISTDLVFDGKKSFSSEGEAACPVCYYGKTKLEGEKKVLSVKGTNLVLRASLLYGLSRNGSNCFTETIIDELRKGNEIRLFTDEFRTPLFIDDLCSIIYFALQRNDLCGIFHAGGPERMSRYEFGMKVAEIFDLDKNLIVPVSLRDLPVGEDKRPVDCSLDSSALWNKIPFEMTGLKEGLLRMKNKKLQQKIG